MSTLSLVIPTFNRAHIVNRSVDSVLRQTRPGLEVIVADDGSTDETVASITSAYLAEPSVQIGAFPHAGVSATRNRGARMAGGEFLAFLDSDDELLPGWHETLQPLLTSTVGLVRCDGILRSVNLADRSLGLPTSRGMYPSGAVLPGTWIVSRTIFSQVGGYDERLTFAENTELLIRLLKHCARRGLSVIERSERLVVVHRRRGRAIEYDSGPRRAAELMLEDHADVFDADPDLRKDYLAIVGAGYLNDGMRRAAVVNFARSWRARPRSLVAPARLARAILPLPPPRGGTPPLVVITCPGAGRVRRGYESFALELRTHLAASGHRVVLLGGRRESGIVAIPLITRTSLAARLISRLVGISPNSVEHYSFGLLSLPWMWARRPDVIVVSERPLGNFYSVLTNLGPLRRCRIVFSNGGSTGPPFDRFDAVHHVSPATYPTETAPEQAGPAHFLLPYAVSIASRPSREHARPLLGLPDDRPIVISVGALDDSRKRMRHVISEVALLESPRPLLYLVGEHTEESEDLREFATKSLGRDGFMMATLDTDRMPLAYAAANAFVLASTSEGFGRVYIEALAFGLPCVVHDGDVMHFVLGDLGRFVDMEEPGAVADALHEYLDRPPSVEESGRRMVRAASFSWDALGPKYDEMIHDVLAGGRRGHH